MYNIKCYTLTWEERRDDCCAAVAAYWFMVCPTPATPAAMMLLA